MSLLENIANKKVEAMKAKDADTLSVLRVLWSAVQLEQKENGDLNDAQVEAIVSKQVKQLKDALVQFEDAGREDLIEKTQAELVVLKQFLPEPLSDDELRAEIRSAISTLGDNPQFGAVMGKVMASVGSRADGAKVKQLTQELLS